MKRLAAATLLLAVCLIAGCSAMPQDVLPSMAGAAATPEQTADAAASEAGTEAQDNGEVIDYAAEAKMGGSEIAKQEVTVAAYVDGDTVHFSVPESVDPSGVLKARFIGVDTPESTGKIEEYGKKAAGFTKERLSDARSIVIESDNGSWNLDSTGGRSLVWVWYKPQDAGGYRNLNIELLQQGLAVPYSSSNNRLGSVCMAAIAQARRDKLNIYSGEKDPDFYYGDAVELTLKELRLNIADYEGVKVAFEGVITINGGNSVFVEQYDEETGLCYGMSVYYGYGMSGAGLDILSVGNLSRIVGTVQYYEAGDRYQVSGLSYRQMKPDAPDNIKKIASGYEPRYAEITAADFAGAAVKLDGENGAQELELSELLMDTTVSMKALKVKSVYIEDNGKATLSCESSGAEVSVRVEALTNADGEPVITKALKGKHIDVKGVVDSHNGFKQVHVFLPEGVAVKK